MPGKKKSKGKKGGKSTKSSGGATKGGYADPFAPSDEIPPPPKPGESVSRAFFGTFALMPRGWISRFKKIPRP